MLSPAQCYKQIILGVAPNMPKEAKEAFSILESAIKQNQYYKEHYAIVYMEDSTLKDIVWRMFIYDKEKAISLVHKGERNLRHLIGPNQIVSIYYDNKNVLGLVGRPYIEVYDGDDTSRFFPDSHEALLRYTIKALKRRHIINSRR